MGAAVAHASSFPQCAEVITHERALTSAREPDRFSSPRSRHRHGSVPGWSRCQSHTSTPPGGGCRAPPLSTTTSRLRTAAPDLDVGRGVALALKLRARVAAVTPRRGDRRAGGWPACVLRGTDPPVRISPVLDEQLHVSRSNSNVRMATSAASATRARLTRSASAVRT